MSVDAHSTGGSPAEEPVDGDLVQAEDASIAAERRGLRRQRLAPFEPSVGEEHPGVCRGRVKLDARRPRRCARPDAARLAPEAGALADAVAEVERRLRGGGDGVGAIALDEAPGTVLPVTRRAGARQRGAPALLRIFAEGVGDDVVDDVRRGLEVDGQAPIRLGGSIAVEDGASEASLGDRGVGESGPLPSILWESFLFRWKAYFFGLLQDPSASGVRHREGGSGFRASASAHGKISGWKLTCIHETQVLPAEDLVRPPVYELPGRKAAPFCEPPRAPRAFPTDHVSQKQFSGERGCAARTPTARDTIISTRRREEVILDKLPSARDTIARTAAAHARTF